MARKTYEIPNVFLAYRLYEFMDRDSPVSAKARINELRRTKMRYGGMRKEEDVKREVMDRNIINYATIHGHPKNGIPKESPSYKEVKELYEAFKDPENADSKLLNKLHLDEKIQILTSEAKGNLKDVLEEFLTDKNNLKPPK